MGLASPLRTVTGRILDPSGSPLEARIGIRTEGGYAFRGTDAEGRFRFPKYGLEEVTLAFSHESYARMERTWDVPGNGELGDIVAGSPLRLDVHVRDETGRKLEARVYSGSQMVDGFRAETIETGHYRFTNFAMGEHGIGIDLGGRRHVRKVYLQGSDELIVTLPEHGELAVQFPGFQPDHSDDYMDVNLYLPGQGDPALSISVGTEASTARFDSLHPGEYEVRLESWLHRDPYKWLTFTHTETVIIRPGKTSQVQLTARKTPGFLR